MAIPTSIQEFLKKSGRPYTTLEHPAAFTSQEEAAAAHVSGKEWAKTVVCFADDDPILAVLPAHYTVETDRLRTLAGARKLRLAEERELAPLYPECEPGAMPPLGPLYEQPVFVERSLTDDPEIVFDAGTHTDAIRMRYADFAEIVEPTVGEFGRPPGRSG